MPSKAKTPSPGAARRVSHPPHDEGEAMTTTTAGLQEAAEVLGHAQEWIGRQDTDLATTSVAIEECGEMLAELLNASYALWNLEITATIDDQDVRLLAGSLAALGARLRRVALDLGLVKRMPGNEEFVISGDQPENAAQATWYLRHILKPDESLGPTDLEIATVVRRHEEKGAAR